MAIKYHSNIRLMDNNVLQIGTGGDLKLEHTGSHSNIYNTTGNLNFINYADDQDIIFQCDDGSGGVTTYITLDGGFSTPQVRVPDNVTFSVGDSQDLRLEHDGSDSRITQGGTGDLIIRQTVDDADLILQCDDGSGGTTAYITLDGSAETTIFSKQATFNSTVVMGSQLLKFADNGKAYFGDSNDLQLYHDATNSYIHNDTGDLRIENDATDGDIIFRSDNGSGGLSTYFRVDGGLGKTIFPDNQTLAFGSVGDLQIYHDGTDSRIYNDTGDFVFRNSQDDGDVKFQCDNGSGGVTTYLTLDGGDVSTIVSTIKVMMPNLPTSNPSTAGQLWNDSGTLKISAG